MDDFGEAQHLQLKFSFTSFRIGDSSHPVIVQLVRSGMIDVAARIHQNRLCQGA